MIYSRMCRLLATCLVSASSFIAYASPQLSPGQHLIIQAGGFSAHQGNSQFVGIQDLIGDQFYTTNHTDQNFLVGIGYYLDGASDGRYSLQYGVNGFYLAPTTVKGNVTQENLFTNLSYQYDITNIPLYLMGKVLYPLHSHNMNVFVDGGIGVNFIQTTGFSEQSLDGGFTRPDHLFAGQTTPDWSFTIGVGIQFAQLLNQMPVELAYRFFYLGQGSLEKMSQVKGQLNTGHSYANALQLSASIF